MRTQRGFTLIELLLVMVVLVVLLAAGIPGFGSLIRAQRIKSASFELYSALVLARSEAITRNTTVTVAPTGGNWGGGWTVTESGGTVLRQDEGMTNIAISGPGNVVYRGSGRVDGAVFPQFELSVSGESTQKRCIRIDLSGRPYTKAQPC
ncbi:MAG TPA: GspH/FimT family pseudopilin [Burkholderiales bacterium]|nr:GspH/FimT family pseudopilin [Burkholderiales bacterium]